MNANDYDKKQIFNQKLVGIILKSGPLTDKDFQVLDQMIIVAHNQSNWHVPYEIITEKIYTTEFKPTINIVNDVEQKLKSYPFQDNEFANKIADDILRHIKLAIVQKEYIDKNIKTAQDAKEKISNELESIQDTKSKIYTDFITILGIFTAITFAIFGGLQLIGNTLGGLSRSMSFSKIGGVLIIASVILLTTYLILMTLVVSLSKLLSKHENKRYKFTAKITIWIVFTIIGLFAIGCLFLLFNKKL